MHQQMNVGTASETVEVSGAAGAVNTESATTSQDVVAQNQTGVPLQGRKFVDLDVVKAKDPVPAQAAASAAPAPQLASPGPLQNFGFCDGPRPAALDGQLFGRIAAFFRRRKYLGECRSGSKRRVDRRSHGNGERRKRMLWV